MCSIEEGLLLGEAKVYCGRGLTYLDLDLSLGKGGIFSCVFTVILFEFGDKISLIFFYGLWFIDGTTEKTDSRLTMVATVGIFF